MTKTYVLFGNDHSQSMGNIAAAALRDYNTNVTAIKDAASREMQDTIVSVIAFGKRSGAVDREIVVSNPHVLKPMACWPANGNTPLWDAVGDAIALLKSVPDYANPDVSFLLLFTTDGEEYGSRRESSQSIAAKIKELNKEERWTIVFRVPKGYRNSIKGLGLPEGNIQEWETTTAGMAASTAATTAAVDKFYSARSAGVKSSNVFYASGATVSATAVAATLKDISSAVSLYVVPAHQNGVEIRSFILTKRMAYLKGSAFYQLTKTEPRVSETKLIAIRNRNTGAIYSGAEARTLIGLPTSGNARVHPAGGGEFDIFIQSESTNRKLVANTGVLYWEAIGKPFTADDEAYLKPKPTAPAVVVLPQVAPTNKPTASPIPVTPKPQGASVMGRLVTFYATRELARDGARAKGRAMKDLKKFGAVVVVGNFNNDRFFTFN